MSVFKGLDSFKSPDDFFWKQKVQLCDLDTVCFYWVDSDNSCLNLEQHVKSNPKLQAEYNKKVNSLASLNTIPVWVKYQNKIHHLSMFELYEGLILGKGVLPMNQVVEVSFLSSRGPFENKNLSDLLHPVMYQDFIMVFLLTGKLSRRDFRLRFKTRLLLEQNNSVHLVNLEQVTGNGILLSSEKPLIEGKINFFIDYKLLNDTHEMSLKEMKCYISSNSKNFLYSAQMDSKITLDSSGIKAQLKYASTSSKLRYYFFSYDRFDNKNAVKALKDFVNHSKKVINESLVKAS